MRSRNRFAAFSAALGLIFRGLVFLGFFLWAQAGTTGAGILRGAVAGDVIAWMVLSAVDWPFRRVRITINGLFELALVLLYFQRDTLFPSVDDAQSIAVSTAAFFVVLFARAAAWGVEHALRISGVREHASP
jgi:hypothetical protein